MVKPFWLTSLVLKHSEASRDMSRTASTWAFNAVRLLFRQAKAARSPTNSSPCVVSCHWVFRGIHTVCCLRILKDGWTWFLVDRSCSCSLQDGKDCRYIYHAHIHIYILIYIYMIIYIMIILYMLYYIILYYIILYCIILYCIILYCIVLYCIILYCIILYCIILYYIVLYCIV
jgi:hypothetical protein